MGNPYPATITDESGIERIAGEIDFTDSGNQPGGGSVSQSLQVIINDVGPVGVSQSGVGDFVVTGPGATSGSAYAIATGLPFAVAPGGQVADLAGITSSFTATIAAGGDQLDYTLSCVVTNQLGTEVASGQFQVSGTPAGTPFTLTYSSVGLTWTIITGADLVGTGTIVNSTAGGVFTVAVSVQVIPD